MYQLLNKAITEFHCYPVCLRCFSWPDPALQLVLSVAVFPPVRGPTEGAALAPSSKRFPRGWAGAGWHSIPCKRLSGGIRYLASAEMQKEASSFDRVRLNKRLATKWALPRIASEQRQQVLQAVFHGEQHNAPV